MLTVAPIEHIKTHDANGILGFGIDIPLQVHGVTNLIKNHCDNGYIGYDFCKKIFQLCHFLYLQFFHLFA